MTAVWQAGTTYVPGALCIPSSKAPVITPPLVNPSFETGDLTGWVQTSGSWAVAAGGYSGSYQVICTGVGDLDGADAVPVQVGQSITAQGFVNFDNAGTDNGDAVIGLLWLNSASGMIAQTLGSHAGGKGGVWNQSTVTGVAPAGAASVVIRLYGSPPSGGQLAWDDISWNYTETARPPGLVFVATQAAPGKSGTSEPAWPSTAGVSVTDNQVTWEGEFATRVVWQAQALLVSGPTEPAWPEQTGAAIHDGTIDWIAQTSQITDPNCPQSAIVVISSGKVFAGDNDIIRYCATVNPLDWTSANDAGYLPFGLQSFGSNPVAAMNLYRSNLMAFNAQGCQMWQLDPDPANITLLDGLPIASTVNPALQPVANDLIFLSSRGVRSIGIAASSTNLEAGDIGMPIDPLVQAAMKAQASGVPLASTFVPSLGQYWVSFTNADGVTSTVFVYTIPSVGGTGYWSRYAFPFTIQNFTILNDLLYIRSGNDVLVYDQTTFNDYNNDTTVPSRSVTFPGIVQAPWLDMGNPGVNKMVTGFDFVGTGQSPFISFGYDQANQGLYTPSFQIPPDTVPGQIIAMPICAPSMSFKVNYAGGAAWSIQAVNIYVQDERETA
jgi:hypothetical protein